MDDLELVGETISEIRLAKKQVLSQKELLSERGLKLLPTSYELKVGESVVIVAPGEWDGSTATVAADATKDDTLGPTEVLVQPSSSLFAWDDMMFDATTSNGDDSSMVDRPLIVQRHELAIWDYASIWEEAESEMVATSIPDSKRRLSSLLSTLKSEDKSANQQKQQHTVGKTLQAPNNGGNNSFTSSRERKASNKGKKEKKNRK